MAGLPALHGGGASGPAILQRQVFAYYPVDDVVPTVALADTLPTIPHPPTEFFLDQPAIPERRALLYYSAPSILGDLDQPGVPYFLIGQIAQSNVLREFLGLVWKPELEPARIHGYEKKQVWGEHFTLIPSELDNSFPFVDGFVYWVETPAVEEQLKAYGVRLLQIKEVEIEVLKKEGRTELEYVRQGFVQGMTFVYKGGEEMLEQEIREMRRVMQEKQEMEEREKREKREALKSKATEKVQPWLDMMAAEVARGAIIAREEGTKRKNEGLSAIDLQKVAKHMWGMEKCEEHHGDGVDDDGMVRQEKRDHEDEDDDGAVVAAKIALFKWKFSG
ncbi:hypothetical protein K469DRAFT_366794 [Zopfia rhizophila CBS 207.26]|uniref:Uncharacterized protein n=1 Tax=Zopfia rhizophila CBS 207.26 TaxID=1314779 RepID=A0A6A6EII6_9PEZI|nr:hypothetical protein K469DRAFT_366794 [Zopfia rhizophila CBS 207.26]